MSRNLVKIPFPEDPMARFDEVIDVRSPAEFAEDHVSGSVNLPVLDDAERVRVGTIFKQVSPFEARKLGAALVSRNIARHLESHFAEKGRDYNPLVYCWRGGQRSGSLALVLAEIGWRTAVVEGGYKAYRRRVVETIQASSGILGYVVLNGYTGAGKTRLLRALGDAGEQVLDLEELARHKGSVFGGEPGCPQPSQRRFESLLYDRLLRFDADRPVFVEAESTKIGRLNLPPPLWQRIRRGPVVEIASPLAARAAHLVEEYREWLGDVDRIRTTLERLRGYHSNTTLAGWRALAEAGEWESLVRRLLAEHYDRRYPIGGKGPYAAPSLVLELAAHDDASVRRCAEDLGSRARVLAAEAGRG